MREFSALGDIRHECSIQYTQSIQKIERSLTVTAS